MKQPAKQAHYLGRSIHTLGCCLLLAINEEFLAKALKHLKLEPGAMPGFTAKGAVTSYLENDTGGLLAVVTIRPLTKERMAGGLDHINIAAFIAHEAVHVWQYHLEIAGDQRNHSKEFEAYGIQHIFETLMREYVRQVALVSNRSPRKARK